MLICFLIVRGKDMGADMLKVLEGAKLEVVCDLAW